MREEQPILSICIPTYNRANDLNHNLTLIESYLEKAGLLDKVCLVISNNCSTDETDGIIKHYEDDEKICIHYYKQEHNIGAGPNQVYAVEKATTPWVMLLGDDDYLEPWYIEECLKQIEEHPNLGCIIPNYRSYDPMRKHNGGLREENCKTIYYEAGVNNCIENTWRAHQLSGLCFLRLGIVEEYGKRGLNNLYPQVFFVAYSSLKYDTLHFGKCCLSVTNPPQSYKDWTYGSDGLVGDFMENIVGLHLPFYQRIKFEKKCYETEKARVSIYYDQDARNKVVETIMTGPNITTIGKIYWFSGFVLEHLYTGQKYKLLQLVTIFIRKLCTFLKLIKKSTLRNRNF